MTMSRVEGFGVIAAFAVMMYATFYHVDAPEKGAPSFCMAIMILLIAYIKPQLDRIESLLLDGRGGGGEDRGSEGRPHASSASRGQ